MSIANVVITLGSNGAFYANTRESGHCRAFDVKVRDTTGAWYISFRLLIFHAYFLTVLIRDTFTGAYASDSLRQNAKGTWDIKSAVVRANKAAAITIQTVGAQMGFLGQTRLTISMHLRNLSMLYVPALSPDLAVRLE